jgi:hypothetical protein
VRLSNGALWVAVNRLGLTFKKPCAPPSPASILNTLSSSTKPG